MATNVEEDQQPETSLITQEGIENSLIKYYDIMIVGLTGQGKSTTADKLLIANPDDKKYRKEEGSGDGEPHAQENGQVKMEDLTMWALSNVPDQLERVSTRLKNLVFFRKLDNPEVEINKSREAEMGLYVSTNECELFSNESTEVRVLDVPGFFSMNQTNQERHVEGQGSNLVGPPIAVAVNTNENHLVIMRSILRIQAAMRMKFRCILYFLPFRGPIERGNRILQQELQLMAYYFGKPIFQSMVLVATLPGYVSKLPISGADMFPKAQEEQTQRHFREVLQQVLQPEQHEKIPNPPVIFLSLTEPCEVVLEKIKAAKIERNAVQLRFVSTVCARCSMKVGWVKGEKVACSFGDDLSKSMPYEDSTCHPILIPKYTRLQRIKAGIAYYVQLKWTKGEKLPDFETEICPACGKDAGTPGCMQVGKEYHLERDGGMIRVDHDHKIDQVVEEHRELEQYEESGEESEEEEEDNEEHQHDHAPADNERVEEHPLPPATNGSEIVVEVQIEKQDSLHRHEEPPVPAPRGSEEGQGGAAASGVSGVEQSDHSGIVPIVGNPEEVEEREVKG